MKEKLMNSHRYQFRFTIIEPYLFEVTFTLEILASQEQNGSCVILQSV